ncbi:hypothetical protein Dimus_031677, partial [Dionaea muscipula]
EAEAIRAKAVGSAEAINTLAEALLGYESKDNSSIYPWLLCTSCGHWEWQEEELLGSVRSVEVLRLFTVLRPSSEDDEEDHEMREDVDSS